MGNQRSAQRKVQKVNRRIAELENDLRQAGYAVMGARQQVNQLQQQLGQMGEELIRWRQIVAGMILQEGKTRYVLKDKIMLEELPKYSGMDYQKAQRPKGLRFILKEAEVVEAVVEDESE